MAKDFTWLLAMHETASRFGDGLKPELETLLRQSSRTEEQGAVPLSSDLVSAGPKHQFATKEQLDRDGIPVLKAVRKPAVDGEPEIEVDVS